MLAGHDLRGGEVDRVETRGAEAVDLHARDRIAVTGGERRGARNVAARFADRVYAAEHDVIDDGRIGKIAFLDRAERLRGELQRGHLMQRAIGLALTARGADCVVNECVGHWISPSSLSSSRASAARPGIHNHRLWLWVPARALRALAGTTGETTNSSRSATS